MMEPYSQADHDYAASVGGVVILLSALLVLALVVIVALA